MRLAAVSINHQTANQDLRGCLSLAESDVHPFLEALLSMEGIAEAVVLSTCNRVEVYLAVAETTEPTDEILNRLAVYKAVDPRLIHGSALRLRDREVVEHLFRVVCSLDSMVVGEAQILGQVKSAYSSARESGAAGAHLNYLFQRSFALAKKVRTEFGLGQGRVSVASMAVDFAGKLFGDLSQRKALVIGTGKMGILTLRYLRDQGMSRIWVVSRSLERAARTASGFRDREVIGVDWGAIDELLLQCDVLITSTGHPDVVFDVSRMTQAMKRRRGRPLMAIDLALPRDVAREAGDVPGLYLYDLDGLKETARHNAAKRAREVSDALCLVQENVERFLEKAAIRAQKRERIGKWGSGVWMEARELTKGFQGAELFRNLSFQCHAGRCLSVIGPTGSGKSTLLGVLSGWVRPDHGEVAFRVDGHALDPIEAQPMFGCFASGPPLRGELSAAENLLYFAGLRGIALTRSQVQSCLEEVGFSLLDAGPTSDLSDEKRQRLSLACVMVHRPRFLFLDEPWAIRGAAGRDLLGQVIHNVCSAGGITILATSDPLIAELGDMELRLGLAD
ncbi:MAG: glutamyl-tRNA reductase [Verrucomicrobiota bacterium]|nr:glutamyl-tRNA reductase [Verrucomicrobiota bacterium]